MVLIQTTEDNVKFYALNMLHDLAHDYTNSEERIKNLVIAYNEFFTQHGGFKQSSNILEKNENFMKVFYELKFYYYTLKYDEKTGLFNKHVTSNYFYNMMSANINDYVDMDGDNENSKEIVEAVERYNKVVEILGDKFSKSENLMNLEITDLEIFPINNEKGNIAFTTAFQSVLFKKSTSFGGATYPEGNAFIAEIINYYKSIISPDSSDNTENPYTKMQLDILNKFDNNAAIYKDVRIIKEVVKLVNADMHIYAEEKPDTLNDTNKNSYDKSALSKKIHDKSKKQEYFLIDTGKSGVFNGKNVLTVSSMMDGIDEKKNHPNVLNDTMYDTLNTENFTEVGNMGVKLQNDDSESHVELSRIRYGDEMQLRFSMKFNDKEFTSVMKIRDNSVSYKINNVEFRPIEYSDNYNTTLITGGRIAHYAYIILTILKNNDDIPAGDLIKYVYGCLVFKSFGDIMQEWNGVLAGGGYIESVNTGENGIFTPNFDSYLAPTYSDNQAVTESSKFTNDNKTPLRVVLCNDNPSGARVIWSLNIDNENINSQNCYGGYLHTPIVTRGIPIEDRHYYIFNAGDKTLYFYASKKDTGHVTTDYLKIKANTLDSQGEYDILGVKMYFHNNNRIMNEGFNIETTINEDFIKKDFSMFDSIHDIYVSKSYLYKFSKEKPKKKVSEQTPNNVGRKRMSKAERDAKRKADADRKKERDNLNEISNITLQDAGYYSSDEDYSEQDQSGGKSNTKMDPVTYSVIAIGVLVGVLLGIK